MKVKTTITTEKFTHFIYLLPEEPWTGKSELPHRTLLQEMAGTDKEFTKALHLNKGFFQQGKSLVQICTVGLGPKADATILRKAAGTIARDLKTAKAEAQVADYTPLTMNAYTIKAMSEGLLLGSYSYEECKSAKDKTLPLEFTIVTKVKDSKEILEETKIITSNICLARDWVNKPSNILYPEILADFAQAFAKKLKLSCEVLDKKALTKKKMGGILAIGQGSDHEPRMITVKYQGAGKNDPYIAFVGKGVTFDSGGISLKPSEGMGNMKDDMAGAAAALAAVKAIAELKLPVNVMAVAGCVENMPSGSSVKPGDVVISGSGKTIEVDNTDAEGRVVLADAVWYAGAQGAKKIIDLATLTGACLIALGLETAGVLTNNKELCKKVLAAGKAKGESYWVLPSLPDVRELLKAPTGDVLNATGRWGGTISAGLFIEEFVPKNTPWVHLDIAGPANTDKALGYWNRGATGFGVATLVQLAREL